MSIQFVKQDQAFTYIGSSVFFCSLFVALQTIENIAFVLCLFVSFREFFFGGGVDQCIKGLSSAQQKL
jgi:hypothetical protein